MDIEHRFDLILENYKLNCLFKKFVGLSILITSLK